MAASCTHRDGLDVSEGGFTDTDGDEGDGLVDTSEWRDIDGLSSDGTGGTDTSRVFAWASVDDGVDEDLDWVGVGHEVNDLKGVLDDADGHLLPVGLRGSMEVKDERLEKIELD